VRRAVCAVPPCTELGVAVVTGLCGTAAQKTVVSQGRRVKMAEKLQLLELQVGGCSVVKAVRSVGVRVLLAAAALSLRGG
jgi:hypothetical protein